MSYTKEVFVFGSNTAGIHGAGAASYAREHYGAKWGIGFGYTSETSFAIPTKDSKIRTLSLTSIEKYVDQFLEIAARDHNIKFMVTAIGTGLAGYQIDDIAPMFAHAPQNVFLPKAFVDHLSENETDYICHQISFTI